MFTAVFSQLRHHGTPAKCESETRQRSAALGSPLFRPPERAYRRGGLPGRAAGTPPAAKHFTLPKQNWNDSFTRFWWRQPGDVSLGRVSLLLFEKPPLCPCPRVLHAVIFSVKHLAESHAPTVWTSTQHLSNCSWRQDVTLLHSLKMENQNFFRGLLKNGGQFFFSFFSEVSFSGTKEKKCSRPKPRMPGPKQRGQGQSVGHTNRPACGSKMVGVRQYKLRTDRSLLRHLASVDSWSDWTPGSQSTAVVASSRISRFFVVAGRQPCDSSNQRRRHWAAANVSG